MREANSICVQCCGDEVVALVGFMVLLRRTPTSPILTLTADNHTNRRRGRLTAQRGRRTLEPVIDDEN